MVRYHDRETVEAALEHMALLGNLLDKIQRPPSMPISREKGKDVPCYHFDFTEEEMAMVISLAISHRIKLNSEFSEEFKQLAAGSA